MERYTTGMAVGSVSDKLQVLRPLQDASMALMAGTTEQAHMHAKSVPAHDLLQYLNDHTFSEDVPVLPQPALMTRGPFGTSGMAWDSSGNAGVGASAVLTLLSRLTRGAPAAFLDLLRVIMPP